MKGFTLIELLVVISIIGILIALTVVGLQGARESSRDAKRKADLEEIRSGLEIYKSDCNDYPAALSTSLNGDGSPASTCPVGNIYIEAIPKDPVTGAGYVYTPIQVGSTRLRYEICATLEKPPTSPQACQSGTCVSCNYRVVNP